MTAEYIDASKQGYPVIYRGKKAAVLFRQSPHQPYVVAHGYDEERGDWSQGSYLDDLKAAMAEADGEDVPNREQWAPDADSLREAAEALIESTWTAGYYHKRYLVAATEWYAWRYLDNLSEIIASLANDAGVDWGLLDDRERTGVLAGIAFNHAKADWVDIDGKGDFESRCSACIFGDIARDPVKYMNMIDI